MRCWSVLAVSSALLFLSVGPAPHHSSANSGTVPASSGLGVLLITEFYPTALSQDEYFVLSCTPGAPIDLLGWSITDGEGVIKFARGFPMPPAGSVSLSMNSSSYLRAFGHEPTISFSDAKADGTITVSGSLRLGDTGDSLSLVSPAGETVDSVKFGSCGDLVESWSGDPIPNLKAGEVCHRISRSAGWQDADRASDWFHFREFKYGFTEFAPLGVQLPASSITAFVSPDCSLEVVLDSIRNAQRSVRLCSYEISSSAVGKELMDALLRGVKVRILTDGAPAGGMDDRQIALLSALADAGSEVAVINGNLSEKIVQHIGPLHAKYMVIDSSSSIILSENFVESGLPMDRFHGNRGWGVRVDSPAVASYLGTLFDSDARESRPDVIAWQGDDRYACGSGLPLPPVAEHLVGALRPHRSSADAQVTVIVSPDCSAEFPFLQPVIRGSGSMAVEQFQVDLLWEGRWTQTEDLNPLIGAMMSAIKEGSQVRAIFDSSWFNVEGNHPAMDYLSSAATGSSGSAFRSICNGSPISVVHNKGALFDGRLSLVSSNNWGLSSFAKNRELALLIDSPEIEAYFENAFTMDWEPDVTPPEANAGGDLEIPVGRSVMLNGSLSEDDRVVANYSWDIDGDDVPELYGEKAIFIPKSEGPCRITLTVTDPWGNEDSDQVLLMVVATDVSAGSPPLAIWSVPAASALAALVGALIARARGPRKINHPPPPDS